MLTHEELQAIKARAEAATPGPWTNVDEDGEHWKSITAIEGGDPLSVTMKIYDEGGHSLADAEFIAHARTDVPALVAEVERLRKALLKRGAAECYQCGTILDDENRHISGLMCIPCSLPVMDTMK